MIDLPDRLRGILWGLMCGDALGSPAEFKTPSTLRAQYPDGVRDMVAGWGNTKNRRAGEITDDSEMAIALLGALVAARGFKAATVREAYHRWLRSNPADIGGTIYNALAFGESSPSSEANGALMRIAPLAIAAKVYGFDWMSPAREDARLTHVNPKCGVANQAYMAALMALLDDKEPQEAWAAALELVQRRSCPALEKRLREAQKKEPVYYPQVGWVEIAFQCAFYWLLHAASYEQALLCIVNRLGDTDTNAAIAGALLGARFGASGIPESWRRTVQSCKLNRPAEFSAAHALKLMESFSLCA